MLNSGYCDLNIEILPSNFQKKSYEHLFSLGYKVIAINTVLEEEPVDHTKKKKGQIKDVVPPPQVIPNIEEIREIGIQVLNRITAHFTDAAQLQKFSKAENTKKYDLISVIPSCFAAFQLACACKDIDLISFDASNRPIKMNRKSYNLAVANNVYFEIPYAAAIGDSGKRKHTMQTAHEYYTFGKSKNVILVSGAKDINRVRSPYDVAHLGLLFGLSEEQMKYAMTNLSRMCIRRAEGRRFGKTAMTMMVTDCDPESAKESEEDEPIAKRLKTTADSPDSEMSID